jgi:hypothetical protein
MWATWNSAWISRLSVIWRRHVYYCLYVCISIQPWGRVRQEPEPGQATGMALAHCILGKFLGVGCPYFPPPLDVPTFASRCLHVRRRESLYQRRMEVRARNGRSNVACDFDFHVNSQGSLTCHKTATWDRRLYFPSEGRHAVDFFRPKNPTASAGIEPAILGTRGQHVNH